MSVLVAFSCLRTGTSCAYFGLLCRRELICPRLVNVGALYERLGEDAVNAIAAWLDQVYDAKAERDALRRKYRLRMW